MSVKQVMPVFGIQNLLRKPQQTTYNIPRPQASFNIPIDNSAETPFKPKLKEKPNSLCSLSILPEYDSNGDIIGYSHPYEIELLMYEPTITQLQVIIPKKPEDIKVTEFVYVEQKEQLRTLLELKAEKEIAIDLEHHSYRSYQGITCLMQISTNKKDYIIDTLTLRDDLQILNEVFTDPGVLKIFHGADSDIEWLQRDLGLYVVNMFDTYQAAKVLGLGGLSLKYLLLHYCNVIANKQFQLADWRIRPLPTELINYARQDTHYLIYIAHKLRNELLDHANGLNMLKAVYMSCRDICRKKYVKPVTSEDSFLDMYKRSKRTFDNRQLYALKEIFIWRDNIARLEDESSGYVLPNHMLLQIAENLPREMQGVLACCNPVPSLLRQNLISLHKIILKARDQPLVKKHINQENSERTLLPTKDFSSKINSLYDSSFEAEVAYHLSDFQLFSEFNFHFKSVLNIFEENRRNEIQSNKKRVHTSQNVKFASPYQRYKAVVSINEQESQKANMESGHNRNLCPVKGEKSEHKFIDLKKSALDNLNLHENKNPKENIEVQKLSFISRDYGSTFSTEKNTFQFPNEITAKNSDQASYVKSNIGEINEDKRESAECFNYSTIDIKKFGGGSKKHSKIDQRKGVLKKRKTDWKKYNRMFTFNSGNKR
ncbi:exosome component 10 isoform X2 [Condylostylus longicornis]|uniref:exosome component 10 isoform X2 n=1 Tax=Condylostylus longicornis TaxID=2530218 RepID=UPI00244E3C32|nr:exosome component 10 isoform X2 [Condylostylus longicornis]